MCFPENQCSRLRRRGRKGRDRIRKRESRAFRVFLEDFACRFFIGKLELEQGRLDHETNKICLLLLHAFFRLRMNRLSLKNDSNAGRLWARLSLWSVFSPRCETLSVKRESRCSESSAVRSPL